MIWTQETKRCTLTVQSVAVVASFRTEQWQLEISVLEVLAPIPSCCGTESV